MVPDQLRLVPVFVMLDELDLIGELHGLRPDQPGRRHEPLPDAPVLPDDPEGLRGGREARRRRLLQDVLAGDAAARGAGDRGRRDPGVPGDLERLLLAADPVRAGRPTSTPCSSGWPSCSSPTRPCGRRSWPASLIAILPIALIFSSSSAIRRRRRLVGGEGMRPDEALGVALATLYGTPGGSCCQRRVDRAVGGSPLRPRVLPSRWSPCCGPLAAGLVHMAVARARRQRAWSDAVDGLWLHWRLGLRLGASARAGSPSGSSRSASTRGTGSGCCRCSPRICSRATASGSSSPGRSPWPDGSVRSPPRRASSRAAASALIFGIVLLLINAAGVLAIIPVLTLTLAYSFLAAAHFVLSPKELTRWQASPSST